MLMSALTSGGTGEISLGVLCVIFWVVLIIVFFIVEMISLGLTSIWFALGALAAGIAAMFGAPIWLQCVVFIVVTALSLAFTRKFAMKHIDNKLVKTNSEELIGEIYPVLETIDNERNTGKIKVRDLEWKARLFSGTYSIPKDSKVVIREIRGVTCYVEPVSGSSVTASDV